MVVAWPIVVGLLAGGRGDMPAVDSNVTRVRAASAELRVLIEDTATRSPTVRNLIARIASTDVIVYVEMTGSPRVPTARTKLVTTVPGARFIRIGINTAVTPSDRAPLLAHELQHVKEIAERADVRDQTAMRRLYARIGRASGEDAFETDAARTVEWTVRGELRIKIGG